MALDQAAEVELTSEERWRLVWGAVVIYYTYDATIAMVITTVTFFGGLLMKLFFNSCPNRLWIASMIVWLTRCMDACCGCYGLMKNPLPTRREMLGDIVRNMLICVSQLILGVVMLVWSATFLKDEACYFTALFGAVGAVLLLMQAWEEVLVWPTVFVVWVIAGCAPVPNWVDCCIPTFIKNRVLQERERQAARDVQLV